MNRLAVVLLIAVAVLGAWAYGLRADLRAAQAAAGRDAEQIDAMAGVITTQLVDAKQAGADQRALRERVDAARGQLASQDETLRRLERENQTLRQWADAPLPDLYRRLYQRPAFAGAAGYRDWLRAREPLPDAGQPADDQR